VTIWEVEMTDEPSKVHIQLALTPRQKRQIRAATGREINTLELRLAPLPEPTTTPAREEEQTDRRDCAPAAPSTRRPERTQSGREANDPASLTIDRRQGQ
jgi:hypothetical protein